MKQFFYQTDDVVDLYSVVYIIGGGVRGFDPQMTKEVRSTSVESSKKRLYPKILHNFPHNALTPILTQKDNIV